MYGRSLRSQLYRETYLDSTRSRRFFDKIGRIKEVKLEFVQSSEEL